MCHFSIRDLMALTLLVALTLVVNLAELKHFEMDHSKILVPSTMPLPNANPPRDNLDQLEQFGIMESDKFQKPSG